MNALKKEQYKWIAMSIAVASMVFIIISAADFECDTSDAETSSGDVTVSGIVTSYTYPGMTIETLTIEAGTTLNSGAFNKCTIGVLKMEGDVKLNNPSSGFFNGATISKVIISKSCTNIPKYLFSNAHIDSIDISALSANSLYISQYSFQGCSGLKTLDFSKLRGIGDNAFAGSEFVSADLSGLSDIGNSSFSSCIYLESVTFPTSGFVVAQNAFSGCSKLQTLNNISGVKFINSRAFSGCTSLPAILDFSNLTSLDCYAFEKCDNVTEIHVPETCSIGGLDAREVLCKICGLKEISVDGGKVFCNKVDGKYNLVYAESGVTRIDLSADSSIESISDYAFKNCTKLTSVSFSDSVTSIGMYSFVGCSFLESISFPGLTSVSMYAFQNCTKLTSCTIPLVTSLGVGSFVGCSSITSVPNESALTNIGANALKNTGLEKVSIRSGITYGNYAFASCSKLKEVVFEASSSALVVSGYLFSGCSSLTDVTGWENVGSVGANAFYNTGLKSLSFTKAIIIGNYAFDTCSALESVAFSDSATIGAHAFENCQVLESVSFSQNSTIGDYAFYGCPTLSLEGKDGVSDLHGVISIGSMAFGIDTTITSLLLPAGLESLSVDAFEGCIYMASVQVESGSEMEVIGNVVYSKNTVFLVAQGAEEIELTKDASSYQKIGSKSVFSVLQDLKKISVAEGSTVYASIDGLLVDISGESKTLVAVPRAIPLEDNVLTISGVDAVSSYSFCDVDMLELVLNGSVSIMADAFYDCELLNAITINAGTGEVNISGKMMNSADTLECLTITAGDVTFDTTIKGISNMEISSSGKITFPNYAFSSDLSSLVINSTSQVVFGNGVFTQSNGLGYLRIIAADLSMGATNFYADGATIVLDVPAGTWTTNISVTKVKIYATARSNVTGAESIYIDNGTVYYNVSGYDNIFFKSDIDVMMDLSIDSATIKFKLSSSSNYTQYDVLVVMNGTTLSYTGDGYSFAYSSDGTYVICVSEQVSEIRYKVSFDTGCDVNVPSFKVYSGRTLDGYLNQAPVREGYEFLGWYTDSTLTNKYDSERIFSDTVLYAKWSYKGNYLAVDESHGKFYQADARYVSGAFDKAVTLTFVPAMNYSFNGFDVSGTKDYSVNGYTITISSVDGYTKIVPLVTYVSSSSDLVRTVDFDTPTASDDLVLSWSFRVDDIGGVVDTSHSAWLGMSSTPLIVDDYVYIQADGYLVCIDINTGDVVNSVSGYTSTTQFYHYLGYGGGYIVDYVSYQVFDEKLNPVCKIPSDISYLKWYDGYFYGISESGVFCKFHPTETESGIMKNLVSVSEKLNAQFNLYGTTTSGIMAGHYMYYISTAGSTVVLNAVSLGGDDLGQGSSVSLDVLTGRYLDDGWLTYYDGYLYMTSYTRGLFGSSTVSGNSYISYLAVDGLKFDTDSYGYVDLGTGYNSLTSEFVIYHGHGYVNVAKNTSDAKLISFNISENGKPVMDKEVPSVASHGGLVISVNDLTDDGGCIRVYLLSYNGSRPYVFEDLHTVSADGSDVWNLQKYSVKMTDMNYGSQAVRFGQNGQIVYFNDSGAVYCYTVARNNEYTFTFVSDAGESETYTAYGSTASDALESLGSDISTVSALKKLESVFGYSADGAKIFVWKYASTGYFWQDIENFRDSACSTCHTYKIAYTVPTVTIDSAVFSADNNSLTFSGTAKVDNVNFAIFSGTTKIGSDGTVSVTDGKYSYIFEIAEGLSAGEYTLKIWDSASEYAAEYTFTVVLPTHTITFSEGISITDGDTVVVSGSSIQYGTELTVSAKSKEGYHLSWNIELADGKFTMPSKNVTISVEYVANLYKITYMVGNEVVCENTLAYKTEADAYAYTVVGYDVSWVSEDAVVKDGKFTVPAKDVIFTASLAPHTHYIIFLNGDGTELDRISYKFGDAVVASAKTPTKTMDDQYVYEFSGWKGLSSSTIMGDADLTFEPDFNKTLRQYNYTLKYQDASGNTLAADVLKTADYGTYVEGEFKDITGYIAVSSGEKLRITSSEADNVLICRYAVIEYQIVFKNWDGTELSSKSYDYGTSADAIVKPTATRADDDTSAYAFKGWSPEVTNVAGDATYTAVYEKTSKQSGGSSTSTSEITIASVRYSDNRVSLSGTSSFSVVHFAVFQNDVKCSTEGFAPVYDGKYSTEMLIEDGLSAGIYTLKVWSGSSDAATMTFSVGSSETEKFVPSGTGDDVTVDSTEIEDYINDLSQNGTLEVDTSASSLTMSKSDISKLKDKDASLEIVFAKGSVILDKSSLATLTGTEGSAVKLLLNAADTSALNQKIKTVLGDSPVFDITLSVGNNVVSALNGTALVTVNYVLDTDKDVSKLAVWHIGTDGKIEALPCTYNGDGTVTFATTHFSDYAVVYDLAVPSEPDVDPTPVPDDSDDSGNSMLIIAIIAVLAIIVVAGLVVVKKKKA